MPSQPSVQTAMPPNEPDVRLALLEQSVERLVSLIEGLSADVRKAAETASEILVLRTEQARMQQDLVSSRLDCTKLRDEINGRIDRAKADIGAVDGKHETTARKLWFWQGVAWGAGALVGITVGLLAYIGSGAITEISRLRSDLHQLEVRMPRTGGNP